MYNKNYISFLKGQKEGLIKYFSEIENSFYEEKHKRDHLYKNVPCKTIE